MPGQYPYAQRFDIIGKFLCSRFEAEEMFKQDGFPLKALLPETGGAKNLSRFQRPDYIQALLTAGDRPAHLGIALLDSQTRFESVNAALACETQAAVDHHIGKTAREIVGDLAGEIEPTYEKVLRTGEPSSIWAAGNVRNSIETGHWFNYCFPIFDRSGRVQQVGQFVVNVTAEKESAGIFEALSGSSRFPAAKSAELLKWLDESVQQYHLGLELSFQELSRPSTDVARKVDHFRSKLRSLDDEIRLIRELVYAMIDQFRIHSC